MADVVVVGGAGRTGRRLLAALHRAEVDAGALIHHAEKRDQARAAGAASVSVGDLGDPASLRNGFESARAVVVVTPPMNARETEYVANAVTAAVDVGVERLVLFSVLHPFTESMPHHLRKAHSEAAVRDAEIKWTILQPAMYAQSVARYRGTTVNDFVVPFDLGRRFSVVDMADVIEVAVTTATSTDGHDFATYELAGPDALTMRELISLYGEAVGTQFTVAQVSPEQFPSPPGWPVAMVSDVRAMYREYDQHGMPGNSHVLSSLLGREATTYLQASRREAAAGLG